MPLHLLHHKSYHVYNSANIARVRADEAAAASAAQATADRLASARSSSRIALLRGDVPAAITPSDPLPKALPGDVAAATPTGNLFPTPPEKQKEKPRSRAEERALKREEDAHRLGGAPISTPWYMGKGEQDDAEIWEQRRRREREVRRKEWGDPLVGVRRGVGAVKEVERERERWRRMREEEVGNGRKWVFLDQRDDGDGGDGGRVEKRRRRESGGEDSERSSRRYRHHSRSHSPGRSNDGKHRRRSRSRSREKRGIDGGRSRSRDRSRRDSHRSHRTSHRRKEEHDPELERLRKAREEREKAEREKAQALLRKEVEREEDVPGWRPAKRGGRYSAQFAGE
ncbi:hypothetical protein EX30DRAFT_398033 [Ascodesmis nigricans]|uniref:CBF1-interacting co-repressor CIR N-terminal domain-containing protein n=1 Tax=Ascodesmis nigricans TaxID=341454 RepID=A0A4S2MR52_9PEZI|nr:hypothetical protein EX30DRAFT_398033 [Ascodesmis nigricans]